MNKRVKWIRNSKREIDRERERERRVGDLEGSP